MSLHVALEQPRGLENFATLLAGMRLAVDLPHMSVNHPLVGAGVVTLLTMVTLVEFYFTALFRMVR